jgi:sodium/potassium/calcium exchanger 2
VPWLLYAIINQEAIQVNAKGMLCSVSILFGNYNNYSKGRCMAIGYMLNVCFLLGMLVFVVLSIMIFRWRMNKGLGMVMFALYFVFLGVSLLFEYNVITCPNVFPGTYFYIYSLSLYKIKF